MSGLYRLLKHKWFTPYDPTTSFIGKNVIVTGANSGLGFEAAVKFSALGASKLILGVRDIGKGDKAKIFIEARTQKLNQIEVWQLDMNSYDSIRQFADRASKELEHLDIVILNAGVYMATYEQSPYRWEETLQVNMLSTTLLGLLMLPKLKASKTAQSTPVLEIVGSGLHQNAKFTDEHKNAPNLLESYNTGKSYNPQSQYTISKLFIMYPMLNLASLARGSGGQPDVLVTTVCPGACKSNLARGYSSLAHRIGIQILWFFLFRSPESGSRSLVSGVTLGEKAHGRFWQHDEIRP